MFVTGLSAFILSIKDLLEIKHSKEKWWEKSFDDHV